MDAVTKKIIRKSAFLFLMLTVSIAGIHAVLTHTPHSLPAVRRTAAAQTPVIVLDAGHGESTKTESQKQAVQPCMQLENAPQLYYNITKDQRRQEHCFMQQWLTINLKHDILRTKNEKSRQKA